MANYSANTRSNYFSVTDEAAFRRIIASCIGSDDSITVFEQSDGSGKFGFGCYGQILGVLINEDDPDSPDYDAFCYDLQGVLAEDDAIIITEVGNEKLRYLTGYCTVITKNEIRGVDVCDTAMALARDMLDNPAFTTQMDY